MNAYIVGDVLVDAGMPLTAGNLVKSLEGQDLSTHVLTHAHADHAGGSTQVSEQL
ncbi:MAG: MBL fold metallo-hydrolase, partial [Solirubrobacterales bacterium]|nr:MBL fold metallo-hydrolase [Solirubrobacterales bacterium]